MAHFFGVNCSPALQGHSLFLVKHQEAFRAEEFFISGLIFDGLSLGATLLVVSVFFRLAGLIILIKLFRIVTKLAEVAVSFNIILVELLVL